MNNPSGDEENTYHVQNVSDSSDSNSDHNIREQLNNYNTYHDFNRYHEENMDVRPFDEIYLEDSNDDTSYSPRGEMYLDISRDNIYEGPRSYRYVRPVNDNELEFIIDDFFERAKEGESFMSPWQQTPSCIFRLLFLRKRRHVRNGYETYFSAFIETIRKEDWVSDWGFYDVQYYIILFNLIDYRRSYYKTDHFNFNHLNTDRGWHDFIAVEQILEPGFIHRDGHIVLRAGMYPYGSENYKNSKEGNYDSKLRTGFVGLKNHGATCYMNALLQLLYHINIFRNAVCMMVFNIEKTIGKQTLQFYKKKLLKKKKKKLAMLQQKRALEKDGVKDNFNKSKGIGAIINGFKEKDENKEKIIFNTEDQTERKKLMDNIYQRNKTLLTFAEAMDGTSSIAHKNPSGVTITRREDLENGEIIKDPFVACESSSDPSIGTSRNEINIFGNMDEVLIMNRDTKDIRSNAENEMVTQRELLNMEVEERRHLGKELNDRKIENNADSAVFQSDVVKDDNNFMYPLLHGSMEQNHLINNINNNDKVINDVEGRDETRLNDNDSDDLENYSWDESISDSNISVISISSKGSTNYETCSSSSASCYYKKKKKNKVVKSREINYRNILLEEEAERKNAPAVSLALQNLFYKLHTMHEAVSCKELIRSFGWDASDVFTQQDTHELLKLLLDKVEEQMKGTVVEGCVKKLFEGEVETYIECIDIEYKSLRKETYEDIQLDVQGCNNIYESLDKAIEAEILEGDNIYETDGFGKQRAKKGMRFLSFPNICIFLLKRFTFDLQKMETVKLNNHFEFYKELDLSKYCQDGGEYVLQAVSVHQGSMNSGHYYSFSFKHDENVWIKCDDEKIYRVSEYSVINDNFGGYDIVLDSDLYDFNIKDRMKQRVKHYSAYMLVYVKKSLIPSLIRECNPAIVNPQVVKRCRLEEIINKKRMKLRQKILQYIKVKVYDKYSYVYKSFRDLPAEGIPALFSIKFNRCASIWDVYKKVLKALEKIYERKKQKRNTKMCKQTNKKQKTFQMLDHCMNGEIVQTKRDIDDDLEVAEKRTKLTHSAENTVCVIRSDSRVTHSMNNNVHSINNEVKEIENETEFLSAQEEKNDIRNNADIDPNLIYFSSHQISSDGTKSGTLIDLRKSNEANETNETNDLYKNNQQKRKMENWNNVKNHRNSESDNGKGVKTAKTQVEETGKEILEDSSKTNEAQRLNENEGNLECAEKEKSKEKYNQYETTMAKFPERKLFIVEDEIMEPKKLNETVEEQEHQYTTFSKMKEDTNIQIVEQNINKIKLEKCVAEGESENEENILPAFDSDSVSSYSCLTVVGHEALFVSRKKAAKKKKMKKKSKMPSVYAKKIKNCSNSSSSNTPYPSSDSIESDTSDSSSDSSSNSVSPPSIGKSSNDDSSKINELRAKLRASEDNEHSHFYKCSKEHIEEEDDDDDEEDEDANDKNSDSLCSEFTRTINSFFLLISNRDVFRYLAIPLKKYGNYRLWELLEKTNKESNDLFPTLELLYLPYDKKTRVTNKNKRGENRLVFLKYFDIFKQKSISESSLICLDIITCNANLKAKHLERRVLERIVKAMEKGYVTKHTNYDALLQYVKNNKELPTDMCKFKIFVEYNNYRQVFRLDKTMDSNKVIVGDILVFNFVCDDTMQQAKVNIYKEGKRREDFQFTNEFQITYNARANSNMNLKILYKKMKLLSHMDQWENCSYLVNNRDGTYYRVRILTDQEEKEEEKRQQERDQRRERKRKREREKDKELERSMEKEETKVLENKLEKAEEMVLNESDAEKKNKNNTYDENIQLANDIQEEIKETLLVKEKEKEEEEEEEEEEEKKKKEEEKEKENEKEENKIIEETSKEKDNSNDTAADDSKNDLAFNYGISESSLSDISCSDSRQEENEQKPLCDNTNSETTYVEKNKREYIIKQDEHTSLINLSNLLNYDEVNAFFSGDFTISDKNVKLLYVYVERNKEKYAHGSQDSVFSVVNKNSDEIITLINSYITKWVKDPVEMNEHGIEKNKFICRDHQYPFYSPSSSDVVIEKEKGTNINKKKKRTKSERGVVERVDRKSIRRARERKKVLKKTEEETNEDKIKADENFFEFMNYSNEPRILNNNGILFQKEDKIEKNEKTSERESTPEIKNDTIGEIQEMEMSTVIDKQNININGKDKNPNEGIEDDNESENEKEMQRGSESDNDERENRHNNKYLQGYMCQQRSDISYCSSARSSLTFTSETSNYYLENFQEDRLDDDYSLEIYDHRKKQKEKRKLMKQQLKRKKTCRSREGKNGGSGDAGNILSSVAMLKNETFDEKVNDLPLYEAHKERDVDEQQVCDDNKKVENQKNNTTHASNQLDENNTTISNFSCEPKEVIRNNESVKKKINEKGLNDIEDHTSNPVDKVNKELTQIEKEEAQKVHVLKENDFVHNPEKIHTSNEKKIFPYFVTAEALDGSHGVVKTAAVSQQKITDEGDVSLSSNRPFLEEEKKKKKKKSLKK